jgi:hypothetical protein
MVALSIREMTVRPTVWMSLMVLVVTGTPPKTANGAVAAIGVTGVREVGSAAAKRRSASSRVLEDVSVCLVVASDCAVMAAVNCVNDARRLAMSSLVAAGGAGGSRSLMLDKEFAGHDKSRSRQMRLLGS